MARMQGGTPKISAKDVLRFFESRAAKADVANHYAATVFTDTESAQMRHLSERELAFPLLGLPDANARVLDIGCGGGRWAKSLMGECEPFAHSYLGLDFSPGLIGLARGLELGESAQFLEMSAEDYGNGASFAQNLPQGKFTHILIIAVAIYLNDEILASVLSRAAACLTPGGKLYFREGVSTNERLTLIEEPSSALADAYSAVYRTKDEYFNLISQSGFEICQSEDLPSEYFKRHETTCHKYFLCKLKS